MKVFIVPLEDLHRMTDGDLRGRMADGDLRSRVADRDLRGRVADRDLHGRMTDGTAYSWLQSLDASFSVESASSLSLPLC